MRICCSSGGRGQWVHPGMMPRACAGELGGHWMLPAPPGHVFPASAISGLPVSLNKAASRQAGTSLGLSVPCWDRAGLPIQPAGFVFPSGGAPQRGKQWAGNWGWGLCSSHGAAQSRLRGLGGLSPEKRRLRRDPFAPYNSLEGGWSRAGITSPR